MRIDRTILSTFLLSLLLALTTACSDNEGRPDSSSPSDNVQQAASTADPDSSYVRAVRRLIEEQSPVYLDESDEVKQGLERFYQQHEYQPVWSTGTEPLPIVDELLAALREADREGLDPAVYDIERLERRREEVYGRGEPRAQEIAQLDVLLSHRFMQYASHLANGRVPPEQGPTWYTSPTDINLADQLNEALTQGAMQPITEDLTPPHTEYRQLRDALHRYQAIADRGGWPQIPGGDLVARGDTSARVLPLAERLAATGDLDDAAVGRDSVYSEAIAAAVARFQERHALEVDSLLGDSTLMALNVPVEDRLQTITVNMERWRWVPDSLGERHIVVNIPAFRLRAYENGQQAMEMAVVVGESYEDRNTPIFSDEMEYLIFSPYWNIPQSIVEDEILPKARENINFLEQQGYEVVSSYGPGGEVYDATPEVLDQVESGDLRLRQRPGPDNSLGLVKFMFPNQFSIYLHDTPAEHLFERSDRAFSHGCIRVERPVDLAQYALQYKSGWDEQRIRQAMHNGEWQRVELDEPIPVYILYWTASVSDDGRVLFFDDIYGYDRELAQALPNAQPSI